MSKQNEIKFRVDDVVFDTADCIPTTDPAILPVRRAARDRIIYLLRKIGKELENEFKN